MMLFDETHNGTRIVIIQLCYCIKDLPTAIKAVEGFWRTGKMRHWQKWHNKNITISNGYAYAGGVHHDPKNALYKVDWEKGINY